jgi:hypothetical protein
MEQGAKEELKSTNDWNCTAHTTIAIQKVTKARLDGSKAPGQCYDGFITELVDYWERYRIGSSLCSPGRPIRQDAER